MVFIKFDFTVEFMLIRKTWDSPFVGKGSGWVWEMGEGGEVRGGWNPSKKGVDITLRLWSKWF